MAARPGPRGAPPRHVGPGERATAPAPARVTCEGAAPPGAAVPALLSWSAPPALALSTCSLSAPSRAALLCVCSFYPSSRFPPVLLHLSCPQLSHVLYLTFLNLTANWSLEL